MNTVLLRFYFTLNVVMLVLLAFSYPFLDPGSGSAVVAQMSLAVIVPGIVISAVLLYRQTPNRVIDTEEFDEF